MFKKDKDSKEEKKFGLGNTFKKMANAIGEKTGLSNDLVEVSKDTKDAIYQAIDVNGDGQVDIEDIILLSFKVPGVSVDREQFLRRELMKRYPKEVIEKAITTTPMKAEIKSDDIEEIADSIIQKERLKVSGLSALLSTPGGFMMVATIPADIAQYYGCMLRVAQELMYLYGFPQIEYKENEQTFDAETMNEIILCLGVMYGVANAKNALLALSKALGVGVEKQLLKRALTKGTIYPIVKSVSKWFGVKMTKEVFAGFFKKGIPVVGGVIGGGLTYVSFKPCCVKLKEVLEDTYLSNPNYQEDKNIEVFDFETVPEADV